jgi:hypothetical protein
MPLILGTNSIKDTGYDVANSCRFDDGSSTQMNKTISSTSTTWTFSCWIKHNPTGTNQYLASWDMGGGDALGIGIENTGASTQLFIYTSSTGQAPKLYDGKLRDPSAWWNIVIKNSSGTITSYINGTQAKTSITGTALASGTLRIGCYTGSNYFYDGYMAEVVLIDGTAYSADSFGEFNSDSPTIWQPKDVSGLTFGSDGFYLDFKASGNLGNDANGGTDLTEVNLAAIDQTTDTCTLNYSTLNPLLDVNAHPTYSEGNLVFQGTGSTNFAGATIPVSNGKWYVEVKATTVNGSYPIIGVIDSQSTMRRDSTYFVGSDASATNPSGFAVFSNGDIYHNGDNNFSNLTTTYTSGDIIGMALDMDASPNTLGFYKNGALEVTINLDTAPSGAYMFATAVHSSTSSGKGEFNFGNPTFSISSGNTDGDGYGNFEFSVPSGYYALNTKNLAEYG